MSNEYLRKVLSSQNLADESEELMSLQQHRADVEKLLMEKFPKAKLTIRYGGSKAKGTLIKAYYDLDVIGYFDRDETAAGETLKDIYATSPWRSRSSTRSNAGRAHCACACWTRVAKAATYIST